MEQPQRKSVYKYSSELGIWMGLYFFLMSASLLLSVHMPGSVLLLLPLTLAWPVVLWLLLRRIWRECPHYRTLSAMWLSGIWICIFGALICAALSAAWLMLFQPDFLQLYIAQCAQMAQMPQIQQQYPELASQLQTIAGSGKAPAIMEWIFSMIWLTAFSGAVMSLIVAGIMSMRRSPDPHKFP